MPQRLTPTRRRRRHHIAAVPWHVYPFLFFGRAVRRRDYTVWQVRDPICLPHLLDALYRQGAQYGTTLLNMPPLGDATGQIAPIGVRLGASDVLLVVTRLPLDDDPEDVKCILRGHTDLEVPVLRIGGCAFSYLNRKKMILQPGLAQFLKPGFESRRSVKYTQNNGARIRTPRQRGAPADSNVTSAFLLNARLPGDGPRLIACFAMDHISTLAWSLILAHEHPDWLLRPGFTMVDLIRKEVPPRPTSINFARDWRSEVILQVQPQPGESEASFWAKFSIRPQPSGRFGVRQPLS